MVRGYKKNIISRARCAGRRSEKESPPCRSRERSSREFMSFSIAVAPIKDRDRDRLDSSTAIVYFPRPILTAVSLNTPDGKGGGGAARPDKCRGPSLPHEAEATQVL